jgi:cytochrome d ubiquinol oxidase subunit I
MDVELLARIQFGVTAGFHFLFPPMSIGLGVIMVIMEGMFLKTKNPMYERMTKFWTKVFALTFGVGVATGIVMEFEFGTNWSNYSRYVGDIFGSPLAAEAIFAFFLESTFLGILLFGWNKVGPKMHFFSTIMVATGAMMSAFWIIVANSWMHTPAGYHIVSSVINGVDVSRAEITDFWAMVFNPSTISRFTHVISASWLTGAFLVISISAYYIIKRRHLDFAKSSLKIALVVATIASLTQLETGHQSAMVVVEHQPAKLATFEGHFNTSVMDLYFIGYLDAENERIIGLKWPGFLSFLIYGDFSAPVKGRNDFPKEDLPPLQLPFQTYHIMIAIGMGFIGLTFFSWYLFWRKKLFEYQWFLKILVLTFSLPHIANLCGWIAAEVGRQPWAVHGILRTTDALSNTDVVTAGHVLFSLILFTIIYMILSFLFVFLLIRKIKHGPEEMEPLTS